MRRLAALFILVLIIASQATPAGANYGRLTSASGPWGAGSYVFDALGNVRSWTQGSTTGTVSYDATNRVSTYAKTGKPTRAFTYDARGNTAGNGDNTFVYDLANQPVTVGGAIPQTHAYDGNFKRVKTVENGKTTVKDSAAPAGSGRLSRRSWERKTSPKRSTGRRGGG
jgi:hypothetical protein